MSLELDEIKKLIVTNNVIGSKFVLEKNWFEPRRTKASIRAQANVQGPVPRASARGGRAGAPSCTCVKMGPAAPASSCGGGCGGIGRSSSGMVRARACGGGSHASAGLGRAQRLIAGKDRRAAGALGSAFNVPDQQFVTW